jgi:uncharacterized protein YutD
MCRKHGNLKEKFKGFLLMFFGKKQKNKKTAGLEEYSTEYCFLLKKQFRQMEKSRQKKEKKNAGSPTPLHRE